MQPAEALVSNRVAIRRVVESHRARNARVFGSVLRGQDTPVNAGQEPLLFAGEVTVLMRD